MFFALLIPQLISAAIIPMANMSPEIPPLMYHMPLYPPVPFQYMPSMESVPNNMPNAPVLPTNNNNNFITGILESIAGIVSREQEMKLWKQAMGVEDKNEDYGIMKNIQISPQSTNVPSTSTSVSVPVQQIPGSSQTSYVGSYDPKLPPAINQKFKVYSRLTSLINHLDKPNIMFRIGDLLDSPVPVHISEPHIESTSEAPKSFPIVKDGDELTADDSTLTGLLTSGRWKKIDWKRKLLGLDEIPTAEEGNALAQLIKEFRH